MSQALPKPNLRVRPKPLNYLLVRKMTKILAMYGFVLKLIFAFEVYICIVFCKLGDSVSLWVSPTR